jgi:hypothetical protein
MLLRIFRFASQCKIVNSKLLYIKYLYYHLLGLLNSLLVPHNTQNDELNKCIPRYKKTDCCMGKNSDLNGVTLFYFLRMLPRHCSLTMC